MSTLNLLEVSKDGVLEEGVIQAAVLPQHGGDALGQGPAAGSLLCISAGGAPSSALHPPPPHFVGAQCQVALLGWSEQERFGHVQLC